MTTLEDLRKAIAVLPKKKIIKEEEYIELDEESFKEILRQCKEFMRFTYCEPTVKDVLTIDGIKVFCNKSVNYEGVNFVVSEKRELK